MWRGMFLAALASCGVLGHDCPALGCGPTADARLAAGTASIHGATVQICRNAVCGTAVLPTTAGNATIHLSGALDVDVIVWDFAGGAEVEWQIARIDDGLDTDRFTASLTATDGSMIAHKSYTASYVEKDLYGEDCGTCPHVDLAESD